MIELGLADVRAFPGVATDPRRFEELHRRMHRRVFLRSEGSVIEVGAPQIISGALAARCAEVVTRVNRFYRAVSAAYYERPDLRVEHLVNPLLEPLLEIEAEHPPPTAPLSRLDTVLAADGSLRVIEINSVGVCLIHMRGLLYLIRELARGGFADDARALDRLSHDMVVDGFLRFVAHRSGEQSRRLVIGALMPSGSGWFRAGHLLFRAAFQRYGHDYVFGGPQHLEVTEREVRIRGTPVDVLWADFFFYMAYQCARYQETKFPSKLPDFGDTPQLAAALLADRRFLDHLRSGRVVNISPARAYLALPKSLLGWIHRSDRPVPEEDRAFLQQHVARTYGARDRADGLVSLDDVANNRGDFLVKPCQYGGSHGVTLGRMLEPDAWRDKLADIWSNENWAVQEFHEPVKTKRGDWVSLGLANFDGKLGGAYFRTSNSLLVNARDADLIPALFE